METFSSISLWGYEETIEELKNKLWATICELEELRNNSREELRKKEDSINQLIYLVKEANQERDETRHRLQMLLNKFPAPAPNSGELFPVAPSQAPASTVVDESAISPDLSIANFADSGNGLISPEIGGVAAGGDEDDAMRMVFDRLGKKPLPVKGRLLEAVVDAGPILETLFVAGSLPRWRNPPPAMPFLVPPMSIRADDASLESSLIRNCKRQKFQ
ncbi:hypothetical protein KSP39_PZI008885 [Platanthera zijinensis]|uniref:Uncharacterized protein n=1 Tax=Platanthera zijinensis TaxID=2320716 RepID=A0AAP0BKG3_9ASPA